MTIAQMCRSPVEKGTVFTIGNDQPAAIQNSPAVAGIADRFPSSFGAAVVAYFEVISGLVLFGLLATTLGIPYFEEMFTSRGLPIVFAASGIFLRILFSMLLLHGIHHKKPWCLVPYLLVQMMLIFAGPFALMFAMVVKQTMEWVSLIPFVVVFVWVEYFKWRLIYFFYDYLTIKNRNSLDFAKVVDQKPIYEKNKDASEAEALVSQLNNEEQVTK